MKKKVISRTSSARPHRKTRVNSKRSTTTSKIFYTKFYVIGFAVIAVTAGLFGFKTGDKPLVLGTSILAENGSADTSQSTVGQQPPPPNQDDNAAPPTQSTITDGDKNTLVDCAGPDGKHIQVTYEECAALNKEWHRPSFTYTELHPQLTPEAKPSTVLYKGMTRPPGQTQGTRMPYASTSGMRQRGGPPERHQGSPSAQRQIQNGFGQPGITAQSAVARVLQTGSINSVENEASSAATAPGSTPNTVLTQVNNQAVYKINGFSNKKVLGIFPAAFAKTVYVSADNGSVVKTDETLFSKLLEAFSF